MWIYVCMYVCSCYNMFRSLSYFFLGFSIILWKFLCCLLYVKVINLFIFFINIFPSLFFYVFYRYIMLILNSPSLSPPSLPFSIFLFLYRYMHIMCLCFNMFMFKLIKLVNIYSFEFLFYLEKFLYRGIR